MDRLTKKEKGFADSYLETGNGTLAALENYDTALENTAAVIATRTLRKAKVQEYLEKHAPAASSRIVKISKIIHGNTAVALAANRDIMDRAGFKPIERSESKSIRLNVEAKIENEELEALRQEYEEKLKSKLLK
mgnify:CR=1 FL=1